jgi:hypothetical protein
MFTFHWSELLAIVVGGLLLFLGLALLMLRRRNEMLQTFLTPEMPDIEQEFFRVRETKPEQTPPEETVDEPEVSETETEQEDNVQWGTPQGVADSSGNGT